MNAEYEMYSEMLSLYTDGHLNETEQQVLFAELSRNSALREELSQYMLIRNTLRSQRHLPPAHLRTAVFARAGVHSADGTEAASISTSANTAAGLASYRIPLLSFAAGALMMFILSGFVFRSGEGGAKQWSATTQSDMEIQAVQTEEKVSSDNTVASHVDKLALQRDRETQVRPFATVLRAVHRAAHRANINRGAGLKNDKNWHVQKEASNEQREGLYAQTPKQHSEVRAQENSYNPEAKNNSTVLPTEDVSAEHIASQQALNSPIMQASSSFVDGHGIVAQPSSLLTAPDYKRSLPFSFEVRGFMQQSFPNFSLPGLIDPPINNVAAMLQWNLSDTWALGIEAGQETILQEFEIVDGQNTTIIRQNHLGLWGGINAQYILYTPDEASFFSISPLLRGTLGATRMGPMLRLGAGALIRVNERADIAFGGESATFAYRQNADWHSTSKLGLTVGLQIHF